jgi:hypothetical protein
MLKKHQALMKIGGGCVAAALSLTGVQSAQALDFNFSFTNTSGNVSGTVTGTIFGLTNNTSNQQASSIVINSFPAALPGTFETNQTPTTWNGVSLNNFSVSSGAITLAQFRAVNNPNGSATRDVFCLNGNSAPCGGASSYLTLNGTTNRVKSNDVTFTSTAVPFEFHPSLGLLMVLGCFGTKKLAQRVKAKKELENLSLDITSV